MEKYKPVFDCFDTSLRQFHFTVFSPGRHFSTRFQTNTFVTLQYENCLLYLLHNAICISISALFCKCKIYSLFFTNCFYDLCFLQNCVFLKHQYALRNIYQQAEELFLRVQAVYREYYLPEYTTQPTSHCVFYRAQYSGQSALLYTVWYTVVISV